MLLCLVATWLVVLAALGEDMSLLTAKQKSSALVAPVFLLPWLGSLITAYVCYIDENAKKAGKIGLFLSALAILVWFMKLST
ncbi:MAG: hypothetical protein LBI31_05105 [Zoogloeaceae bacterium]|nr:hypothetical protein [Zoogloeaceae bacterium]